MGSFFHALEFCLGSYACERGAEGRSRRRNQSDNYFSRYRHIFVMCVFPPDYRRDARRHDCSSKKAASDVAKSRIQFFEPIRIVLVIVNLAANASGAIEKRSN